jgi:hypothetical protein
MIIISRISVIRLMHDLYNIVHISRYPRRLYIYQNALYAISVGEWVVRRWALDPETGELAAGVPAEGVVVAGSSDHFQVHDVTNNAQSFQNDCKTLGVGRVCMPTDILVDQTGLYVAAR